MNIILMRKIVNNKSHIIAFSYTSKSKKKKTVEGCLVNFDVYSNVKILILKSDFGFYGAHKDNGNEFYFASAYDIDTEKKDEMLRVGQVFNKLMIKEVKEKSWHFESSGHTFSYEEFKAHFESENDLKLYLELID